MLFVTMKYIAVQDGINRVCRLFFYRLKFDRNIC